MASSTTYAQMIKSPLAYQQDTAIIWRGFIHKWQYNHRINRLGNYIEQGSGNRAPLNIHAAASGTGKDKGTYTSYYSIAHMRGVKVLHDHVSFTINGKRGKTVEKEVSAFLQPEVPLKNDYRLISVLNGFDLYAESKAQKVESFRIDVAHPAKTDSNSLNVPIHLSMIMDCQSVECKQMAPRYRYKVSVHFLVLVGHSNFIKATSSPFHHSYSWNKNKELHVDPQQDTLNGSSGNHYQEAVVGFRKIDLDLNRAHWMLTWAMAALPVRYYADEGILTIEWYMLFKQWSKMMKRKYTKQFQSTFASRKKGSAEFKGQKLLLQFRDACIKNDTVQGKLSWPGRNKKASGETAVVRKKLIE